ncbi:MAG: (2Fe-2S) ferredoxin domain-containing protein [Erysipelotrichaceae bacterium]|nr:(2Fe-2S) ferredoxin domain-containing protein [Erysipelotrichaceae bacterium]MDY5252012.1 (2Fe-2S) ferredoxin domain-containing protein [Erysipelotrichaceae bacterium]
MITLEICIGSSCYVKGSNQVVKIVNDLIKENSWEDKVEVKGSFCMQACQGKLGLGIKINGEIIEGVNLQNAKQIIGDKIAALL